MRKHKLTKLSSSRFRNNSIKQLNSASKLNGSKYCYVSLTIQLNISHLFSHNLMIKEFYFKQLNSASKSNDSKYCYVSLTIQLNISHLFSHS